MAKQLKNFPFNPVHDVFKLRKNSAFLDCYSITPPFPSHPAKGGMIHTETSSVQALSLSRERSLCIFYSGSPGVTYTVKLEITEPAIEEFFDEFLRD